MNLITTFDKMKGLCCIYDAMYCLSGLVKSAECTTVIKTHKKPPRKNFQGCRIQTIIRLIKQRNAVLYEYLCILLFFTGTFVNLNLPFLRSSKTGLQLHYHILDSTAIRCLDQTMPGSCRMLTSSNGLNL